jgi:transcriptional regulator with XRE-family HTH domain
MAKAQHAHRYKLLPELLRQMREDAGFTQRGLAAKLRVTHLFVHKSEVSERRVDISEFMDWAIACGVDPVEAFKTLRKQRAL